MGTVVSGWQYLLLCCLGYVPGFVFYAMGRRERGLRPFAPRDYPMLVVVCVGAIAAATLLAVGGIVL